MSASSLAKPTPFVKICGSTSVDDTRLALWAGADFIGMIVDYPPSPRHVSCDVAQAIAQATQEAHCAAVAVTVNLSFNQLARLRDTVKPDILQLHGDEPPELVSALKAEGIVVWAAVHNAERAALMQQAGADAILVDARTTTTDGTLYGGTGQRSDWKLARTLVDSGTRVILAGGLTPDNVAQAIREVQPWAVDVISGVEAAKGRKDPEKVTRFIAAAKNANQ